MSIKLFGLVALLLVASQLILITTLVADGEGTETASKQSTTTCMPTPVILQIGEPESYGTKNTTWRLFQKKGPLHGAHRTIATGKFYEKEGVLSGTGMIISCTN